MGITSKVYYVLWIMHSFYIRDSAAVQRFIICKMSQPSFAVLCLTGIMFRQMVKKLQGVFKREVNAVSDPHLTFSVGL